MIPVQNIYYMLSYAFQALQAQNYKDLATVKFHNTAELCAAILDKGISVQLKRGLGRDYLPKSESLSTLQGKLNISESIKTQTLLKKQMICTYDEFSTNTQFNQIIKSTLLLLLKANITNTRKKSLRNLLLFFSDVSEIDLRFVNWSQHYNRSNQSYQMLIGICYLIYNGLLQTQTDGTTKIMDFFDEQRMCHLYEKFLLEYYRKEHPELSANASQIAWQLDDSENQLLPKMQTDIMLSQRNNILIIDAKYYSHMTQQQYGTNTLHSNNLYQIFTYVKNKEFELKDCEHTVSGMLLYAQTDENIIPNNTYQMSGNQIAVRALNLNQDFSGIAEDLDSIIEKHFLAKLPDEEEAIITETAKVVNTLNSLCIEMDSRYDLLKMAQVRNIKEYNEKFIKRQLNPNNGHKYLPYIVVVVDEFADLIMTAGKEVETPIARIAQLARAVGIHMIIATQRPSTNIITGVIKANFPARIAFKVASMIDSRTILDSPGANQLIGRGDMLISVGSEMTRVQCAFVDTPEVDAITHHIASQQSYPSAFALPEYVPENEGNGLNDIDPGSRDPLFEEAARLVVSTQQGSTSSIQRRFSIGYNRAGRIMDQLEAAGIVGPFEGSKARQVLISDEYSLEQMLK